MSKNDEKTKQFEENDKVVVKDAENLWKKAIKKKNCKDNLKTIFLMRDLEDMDAGGKRYRYQNRKKSFFVNSMSFVMNLLSSSSKNPYLDGIEFSLAEILLAKSTKNQQINLPKRNIHEILEKNKYDFSKEHEFVSKYLEKKEKEQKTPSPSSASNNDEHRFFQDNSILRPSPVDKDQDQQVSNRNEINLSEFESENQDPFTNAELRTIDDIKELSQVFKLAGGRQEETIKPQMTSSTPPHDHHVTSSKKSIIDQMAQMITDDVINNSPKPRTRHLTSSNDVNTPMTSSNPTPKPRSKPVTSSSPVMTSQRFENDEQRRKFEEKINKALTSLPKLPPKKKPVEIDDEDLKHLTADQQNCFRKVSKMGFPRNHVIKVIEDFGVEEKEVIEQLCLIERISQLGFNFTAIQEALNLFASDEKKSIKFLNLQKQFTDMGFPPNRVRRALLLNDCNQQRSLEALMNSI